ncbi:MAG: ATP-binding protein [Candidatus Cloacimonetes bacterium]|nr:ATP-binding protein [Candidatus Cloacimonadota bacterium]
MKTRINHDEELKKQLISSKVNIIKDQLAKLVYKTDILATFIEINDGEVKNFPTIAKSIMEQDDDIILNLILAPRGIVEYVYPRYGNDAVVGLDFLAESSPGSRETLLAVEKRDAVLAGPLQAQQSHLGLVLTGRKAVFLHAENYETEFWGIVSITLKSPETIKKAGFDELKSHGYDYEISRINPDTGLEEVIDRSQHNEKKHRCFEQKVMFLNTEWHFKICPLKSWYQYKETWIFLLIAFLFSWLLANAVHKQLRMNQLKQKMNAAIDYTYLLLNTSPYSCMLWDKELNLYYCNDETYRLFGISKKEDLNNIIKLISPEFQPNGEKSSDVVVKAVKGAFERGTTRVDFLHYTLKGEPIPCEITINPIESHGEMYVAAYLTDMRRQNAYLEEINKARETAIAASKAKSTFLSNMSHEIRTPMNCIIGFAELARDDEISPRTYDYLTNIINSSVLLLDIINDILDVSKIEAGKIELEHIHFTLSDVLRQCQQIISPKIDNKNVTLFTYAEPSIGRKLLGDPTRLRQIIINLLSNAVKFTKTGSIKLLTSVVSISEKSVTIHFEVKDSGIGMTKEQIDKIFEPFSQADESITRKYGGTGLGLAITKNMIELMGSTLNVESSPQIGSRFHFDIKFDTIDVPVDIDPETPDKEMVQPKFEGKILVCEDNILNQQVIKEYLWKVGLDTVIAKDGQEGVDIVKECIEHQKRPFDLIFMDIHMPVLDGFGATAQIQKLGYTRPIIALTANVLTDYIEQYKEKGMKGYLGKPFTKQDLWRCLLTYLQPIESESDTKNDDAYYEELYKKIKISFFKTNQNVISEINNAIRTNDLKSAHRIAHTLKGIAGQISEIRLQKLAEAVEFALKNDKNETTFEQMNELETELKIVMHKIAPLMVNENSKANTATETRENPKDLLKKLQNLLKDKDAACVEMVDDLKQLKGTKNLIAEIENLDFKKALAELKKIKTK